MWEKAAPEACRPLEDVFLSLKLIRYAPCRRKWKGYEVAPLEDTADKIDIFITATGCKNVIQEKHFQRMKSGAVVCNIGHFNVEIDMQWLNRRTKSREIKPQVKVHSFPTTERLLCWRREDW